jgi:hypothetical protein
MSADILEKGNSIIGLDNWTRNEGAFFEERHPLTTATARRTKRRLAAIGDQFLVQKLSVSFVVNNPTKD